MLCVYALLTNLLLKIIITKNNKLTLLTILFTGGCATAGFPPSVIVFPNTNSPPSLVGLSSNLYSPRLVDRLWKNLKLIETKCPWRKGLSFSNSFQSELVNCSSKLLSFLIWRVKAQLFLRKLVQPITICFCVQICND